MSARKSPWDIGLLLAIALPAVGAIAWAVRGESAAQAAVKKVDAVETEQKKDHDEITAVRAIIPEIRADLAEIKAAIGASTCHATGR